ncbi:hypothetical protein [Psychrobacter cryohalolentis]|nr:hypothetical protein [Psychrobacter cryohalolentis]ASE27352.2 hypothetical protein CEP87_12445 [Psychrobacter cryohalolentis]
MSVKLQPNMTQNARDLKICEDYWAYDNKGDYIAHVEIVCEKYEISTQVLFETIGECFAYLDDVRCEYCGYVCPLQIPADIAYMRAKERWCCEVCEHAVWREHNHR